MKRNILTTLLFSLPTLFAFAQTNNVVLIEEFTETGCGACSQYDSSYQVLTNANADKVAVLNYHCFYSEDPFTKYTKAGDQRYAFYQIKDGFPSAMVNGKKPGITSAHLLYVNAPLINRTYNQPAQFKIEVKSVSTGKGTAHIAAIEVNATSLKDPATV